MNLHLKQKKKLLQLAREAINYAIDHKYKALPVILTKYPQELLLPKACFITLYKNEQLRGCVGTIKAKKKLILAVVDNSIKAAFFDSRFPKLHKEELLKLKIEISILTTPYKVNYFSEKDLLSQLRPNIDGLILKVEDAFGTFLPSVWKQLSKPIDFLKHLKIKVGLPMDYWSDNMEIWKYEAETFNELDII